MGRTKKEATTPQAPKTVESAAETTNMVPTEIIKEDALVSQKSGRINVANVGDAEFLTVRSKENGATNTIRAANAIKLVNSSPSQYEIIENGKDK